MKNSKKTVNSRRYEPYIISYDTKKIGLYEINNEIVSSQEYSLKVDNESTFNYMSNKEGGCVIKVDSKNGVIHFLCNSPKGKKNVKARINSIEKLIKEKQKNKNEKLWC